MVSRDFDTLSDFEQPGETEARFLGLLSDAEGASRLDRSQRVEVLSQLARVQSLQGRLGDAKQALSEAGVLLAEDNPSQSAVSKIRFLLESGRVSILEKIPSQARPKFLEAWTLASSAGEDFHAIDAAQCMASVEPQKMQKEWVLKALALAESSAQPRAKQWQGALDMTLGWIQYELRSYDSALEFFKKAVASNQAQGFTKKALVAKWAVAKTVRALKRTEEALQLQKDLLAELTGSNSKDGFVYEELAECLQSLNRTGEAQVYFELAYKELSKDEWIADNRADRLKRIKTLGKVK